MQLTFHNYLMTSRKFLNETLVFPFSFSGTIIRNSVEALVVLSFRFRSWRHYVLEAVAQK